jgi:hypothetical protein
MLDKQAKFAALVDELKGVDSSAPKAKIEEASAEGYSSMEIPEPKSEEPVEQEAAEESTEKQEEK